MSEQNSISVIAASDGVNYLLNDISKSAISVDNIKTDLILQHITQEDYEQLVVDDEVLSNSLYIVSSDYVETYGQQIKNVADPTDLSDAVNKEYVDSNFQLAGNYLTAVPDAYKTYVETKSSLSSDGYVMQAQLDAISSILSGLEDILHEINTGSQS